MANEHLRQFHAAYNTFEEGGPSHRKLGMYATMTLGGTNTDTVISGNPFTQLAADDTIQVKSSAAGDTTQWVTLVYVNTDNRKVVTWAKLNGVGAVTVDESSGDTCRYFEQAYLTAKTTGTITIERDDGTLITTITAGKMNTEILHVHLVNLTGEIEGFCHFVEVYLGSLYNNDFTGALRYFPDMAQSRDVTVGYVDWVRGSSDRADSVMGWQKEWSGPRRSSKGGYLAVIANDGGDWTQVRSTFDISLNSGT